MSYKVVRVEREDWRRMSADAHKIGFKEITDPESERIDYALLCLDRDEQLCSYVTVREMDRDTCYWAYGAAFPPSRRSVKVVYAYRAMIDWAIQRYDNILTYIENDNTTMLKMAASVGYKIIGTRNYRGSVLLEHHLETGEEL